MEALSTAPLPHASPSAALRRFVAHAFRLRGRASRSEYWWWMAVGFAAAALLLLVVPRMLSGRWPRLDLWLHPFGWWGWRGVELLGPIQPTDPLSTLVAAYLWLSAVWVMVTFIPGFTVAVRRLHDSNLSGWWVLLNLLPIGGLILLLMALRRSRSEGARFDGDAALLERAAGWTSREAV
ncbi:DUF805 domain-containing protein [Microbacterium sp. cf332]|uniref:DUF805 domain-containing protein n=1 Tax=Microbacterium sp. cf332 TaxID=1761804 RepID=UPI00087E39B8|nr:DUF805 domain-containing protein [Microbacterium sp. cf332]SDQ27061.1 Uncharacterized membrane protein YhaH, DUF805 family [Microbacterium sp. cf332]